MPGSPLRTGQVPPGECINDLSSDDANGMNYHYGGGGGTGGGCGGCRMLDGLRGLESQIPDGILPLIYDTDYQNLGGVWETLSPSEAGVLADALLLELDALSASNQEVYAALNGYLVAHEPFLAAQGDMFLNKSGNYGNPGDCSNNYFKYSDEVVCGGYEHGAITLSEASALQSLLNTIRPYASTDLQFVFDVLLARLVEAEGPTLGELLDGEDNPRFLQGPQPPEDSRTASTSSAGVLAIGNEHVQIQSFPNPFSRTATIQVSLADNDVISVHVYDVRGRRVATLVDGPLSAGRHSFTLE